VASGAAYNIDNGAGYLAADSSLRRLFVSWTASTDPYVRDYIVQFKKSTDTDFVYYAVTTTTSVYIQPVTLGAIYNVRVAARNELDNRSAFATATAHTVIA
jgi:purine-cytosine permease-like protein